MSRGFAVLAVGLLTAASGRANENEVTVPPPPQPVSPPPAAHTGPCQAAPCGGAPCCARSCGRGNCLQRLWNWVSYRPLPVPDCCKTCCCNHVPYCPPPPYTFFLYGPGTCGMGCRPGCQVNGHAACATPPCGSTGGSCDKNCGAACVDASKDCGSPYAPSCANSCGRWQRLLSWRPGQLFGGRRACDAQVCAPECR